MVLDLNRRAQAGLRCENRLAIAPGATHLFEEPGTLAAAALARDWFTSHPTHIHHPATWTPAPRAPSTVLVALVIGLPPD